MEKSERFVCRKLVLIINAIRYINFPYDISYGIILLQRCLDKGTPKEEIHECKENLCRKEKGFRSKSP